MASKENSENLEATELNEDLASFSKTQLKNKYKREYNSWRNRKAQAKPYSNWSPEFEDFKDFLVHMGPCPPGHTLDRTDNNDPYYSVSNCRWASKVDQANNRSTTQFLEFGGMERPLSEVSAEVGQRPDTVRKRIQRGWTDQDAVSGTRRARQFGRDPRVYKPWPLKDNPEVQRDWEERYHSRWDPEQNRYEYLIGVLRGEIARIQGNLKMLEEVHPDEWAQEVREEYETMLRCKASLVRAEWEMPRWETALRAFLSRDTERKRGADSPPWPRDDD